MINNEIMAIKKVNLTNLPQEECYNINREALYLESLKHKNIIRFKDSFIYENEFYNVMDYAKGGELGAYISEKKVLAENDTKRIFIQIHDAIKYIHSKNVIHRDIKPNNILFLDENRENIVVLMIMKIVNRFRNFRLSLRKYQRQYKSWNNKIHSSGSCFWNLIYF